MRLIALASMLVLVAGCGSTASDPDVDSWEREVRIITPAQIGERQYEELGGTLEAREAIRSTYGGEDTAIATAKRELRRSAAALDADAVVIFECGRHVRPIEEHNLPTTGPEVICHGAAIRWLD